MQAYLFALLYDGARLLVVGRVKINCEQRANIEWVVMENTKMKGLNKCAREE